LNTRKSGNAASLTSKSALNASAVLYLHVQKFDDIDLRSMVNLRVLVISSLLPILRLVKRRVIFPQLRRIQIRARTIKLYRRYRHAGNRIFVSKEDLEDAEKGEEKLFPKLRHVDIATDGFGEETDSEEVLEGLLTYFSKIRQRTPLQDPLLFSLDTKVTSGCFAGPIVSRINSIVVLDVYLVHRKDVLPKFLQFPVLKSLCLMRGSDASYVYTWNMPILSSLQLEFNCQ